jgi:hypothetical protein
MHPHTNPIPMLHHPHPRAPAKSARFKMNISHCQ